MISIDGSHCQEFHNSDEQNIRRRQDSSSPKSELLLSERSVKPFQNADEEEENNHSPTFTLKHDSPEEENNRKMKPVPNDDEPLIKTQRVEY